MGIDRFQGRGLSDNDTLPYQGGWPVVDFTERAIGVRADGSRGQAPLY